MDLNRKRIDNKKPSVHVATACNNIEGLKLVLADPRIKNALSPFDDQLCTPLMTAVAYGQGKEAVRLLLRHPEVDVNQINKGDHITALQYAAYLEQCPSFSLSRTWTSTVNFQETTTGQTALHGAVLQHNNEIVKLLLEHPGLDVNRADSKGKSAFVLALLHENTQATSDQRNRSVVFKWNHHRHPGHPVTLFNLYNTWQKLL